MSGTENDRWPMGVPGPGALVRDTQRDVNAVVMGAVGGYVQLRPPGGGVERDVKPEHVRPLTPPEESTASQAAGDTAARPGVKSR